MQVVYLAEVEPEQLQDIFGQEIQNWHDQLSWDYRPTVELITKCMRSQGLPGYVLKSPAGDIAGYSYYLVGRPVGYIGNLYVRAEFAGAKAYQVLLQRTLRSLTSLGSVQRVECQMFAFNFELAPLFQQSGFTPLKRHFLTLPIEKVNGGASGVPRETGLRVVPWEDRFFTSVAEVVYDSYRGSPDSELCLDYQSPEGCVRFLRNLVDNPGCGTFTGEISYVVLDDSGQLCAVLLTSRIGPETGMIPQLSVRRAFQGKGLGTLLLNTYLQEAKKQGLKRVTLSVSHRNRAYQLYRRLGFKRTKDFHAFIWGLGNLRKDSSSKSGPVPPPAAPDPCTSRK